MMSSFIFTFYLILIQGFLKFVLFGLDRQHLICHLRLQYLEDLFMIKKFSQLLYL